MRKPAAYGAGFDDRPGRAPEHLRESATDRPSSGTVGCPRCGRSVSRGRVPPRGRSRSLGRVVSRFKVLSSVRVLQCLG
jgi:hypothetical protein